MNLPDRFMGCLIGGAVGDALGAPIEFLSRSAILRQFGPAGLTAHTPAYGGLGRITDDTQMTLFTADGLIRTQVRVAHKGITDPVGVTAHAYLRWLMTQGSHPQPDVVSGMDQPGWLYPIKALHACRAPGNTCLSALKSMKLLGEMAHNQSKGCGGIMRMAPVGLWMAGDGSPTADIDCFRLACQLAGLTHGHPTGQLTAGVFAVLIRRLANGQTLQTALNAANGALETAASAEAAHETRTALSNAARLANAAAPTDTTDAVHAANIASLGEGWVAEEAMSISVYCAVVAKDFEHGIRLAINHSGDSDSTGSITGNLLGCIHGVGAIPAHWLEPLELQAEIAAVARDLAHYGSADWQDTALPAIESDETWQRYPGF